MDVGISVDGGLESGEESVHDSQRRCGIIVMYDEITGLYRSTEIQRELHDISNLRSNPELNTTIKIQTQ